MPQPYNYMIDLPDPSKAMMQGVGNALSLKQMKSQIEAGELAKQQQQALQADLGAYAKNPTTAGITQLMVKYPQLSEEFKRTYDVLGAEEQKTRVNQASRVYAAIKAGDHEVAKKALTDDAAAYRNSGREQDAKVLDDMAKLIDLNPDLASTSAGMFLATAMGPDKFAETFTKLEADRRATALEGSTMTEAQAKAQKAATEADFAESNAVMELQKKGWDIAKIQNDIDLGKENARIAAINADLKRETNDLKKQELQQKLDDAKLKRDETVRTKAADLESARSNIDNMLNTADRIMKNPALDDVIGSYEGRMPEVASLLDDKESDAISLINTLGSQAFLSQIPNIKGMGALSNAEGEKLQAALQNFSRAQSEKQFKDNLREAQRLLTKARKNIADRYGVPESIPDTPAAEPKPDEIDALLKKYGG